MPAALISLIAAVFLLPESSATFTSAVNAPATVAASAGFPGLPELISDQAPVFHHRMEESQTASVAADALGPSPGVYGSPPDAPSMWSRFDEFAGSTSFSDVSGAVNTASLTGTATAGQPGPAGGAVTLGANSYLSSAGSPFRADRDFTMSVWFNIGSVVPSTTRIAVLSMTGTTGGTPDNRSDAMIIAEPPANCPVPSSPCWAFGMAGDPQSQSVPFDMARSTSPVTANTWVHLTAVFDKNAGLMSLYVNGSPDGTNAHTPAANAATDAALDAGRYRDASWLGMTGGTRLGEERTWRRALPAAEVTELSVRPTARYAFNESTATGPTYTTTGASTGTPGTVARSAGLALAGGATLTAGREGNAFTTGYLVGPDAQLNTNGSFTVAAWVKLTDDTTDRTYFSASNGLGTVAGFGYSQSSNRWMVGVLTGVLTETATADVTPPVLNQWVHLVALYDQFHSRLRLYVDGVPQTPVTIGTPSDADSAVAVGGRQALGVVDDIWPGQIDDLRVYNGYPLNTAAGSSSTTLQTFVDLLNPGLSGEVPGGLQGSTKTGHAGSTAVAFGGTANAYNSRYSATAATTDFTVECLIRVGPGHSGVIAGFTPSAIPTGLGGTTSDRLLYVDSAGKVRFGLLHSGTPVTVASAATVDDGAWHHITASVGPITGTGAIAAGGLRLSLDGTVTSNAAVTAATASTGIWRWGGAPLLPLDTWPAAPANPYLTGTIDELAVYDKQLTDQDDLWRVYGNY
ncbi:LamG domain-containing protein [Paractinoplanes maris]|uniref:LamG domain-containing protein n=1 Tax=Paractinoplanes maris TaxID=1734446 RepID=UPI002021BE06|nr:LamG domain-containing protein [Actinoplanes maris]